MHWLWSCSLAWILAQTPGAGPAPATEVPPQPAPWADVKGAVFSEAWMLPAELWRAPDGSRDEWLLPLSMKRLAERDFDRDMPRGDRPIAWCKNLGDFALEWRKRGGDKSALDAMLIEMRSVRPTLHAECGRILFQLFQSDALRRKKWDPGDDLDDDGLYLGTPIERRETQLDPWKTHSGSNKFQQAAALVFADVDALLGAENDFFSVAKERGNRYDWIGPVAGSYRVGDDAPDGPFAALRVKFRIDLPFPFTHFDCDLGVLNTLDRERDVVSYSYSASPDLLWMAGEDFFYPVKSSSGEWCGTLAVRLFGLDVRGVPDGDGDRASTLRGAFGNLKRRAEDMFHESGATPRTTTGAVPKFRLLGPVQK
jgi:hypothetical protein